MKSLLLAAAFCLISCATTVPRVCIDQDPPSCGTAIPIGTKGDITYLATVEHVFSLDREDLETYVTVHIPLNTYTGAYTTNGELIFTDAPRDLAMIEVTGYPDRLFKLCSVEPGEEVKIIANTGVIEVRYGSVMLVDGPYIYTNIAVWPGWSGAPIISTERYCVVGIVQTNLYNVETLEMVGSMGTKSEYIPLLFKPEDDKEKEDEKP
jgi:hypothetical protein